MKIFFIFNLTQRKKEWDYRELAAQVSKRYGWTARFGDVDRKNPGSMDQLVRQAVEEGCSRVAVLGGDGTLHHLISVLQRQKRLKTLEIAPLPGGTCNDFCRFLGYRRRRLEVALKQACIGKAQETDLGLMDSQLFLNNAGFGRRPPSASLAKGGPMAMKPPRSIQTLKNFQAIPLKATWEKGSIEGSFYFVMACNAPYFSGGLHFSKKPLVNDGLLDLYFVPAVPKWKLVTRLLLGRLGKPFRLRQMINIQAKYIEIQTPAELWPQADGEPPTKAVHRVIFSVSSEKAMIVR